MPNLAEDAHRLRPRYSAEDLYTTEGIEHAGKLEGCAGRLQIEAARELEAACEEGREGNWSVSNSLQFQLVFGPQIQNPKR